MCDIFREAKFTIIDVFASFDRDGSGAVSVSEFCSLLRMILGGGVDKKDIYNALTLIDQDGDKSISLDEVLIFVYRAWRSQLDDLAKRLAVLDEEMNGDEIRRLVLERGNIKEAIKKNFPRQWRDRLDRMGTQLTGPFSSLLKRMGIGAGANANSPTLGNSMDFEQGVITGTTIRGSKGGSPGKKHRGGGDSPTKSYGANALKRITLSPPKDRLPSREGMHLGLPKMTNFNNQTVFSGEACDIILKASGL